MTTRLEPKIITIFREGYSKQQLLRDLVAGVVVGIVALPLAIAFAIASGVKPEQGLYTAVIAGFVISLLGGSRAQISGPTGAFIVVIYGIIQQYGYDGLAVATLIAGILMVAMGLSGMGVLLRFVPYPLTVGFTSGIALIIFSSQVKDFLGLNIEKLPAAFVPKWEVILHTLPTANLSAICVGAASLLVLILLPKLTHRIPGSLVSIIAVTAYVWFFDINVETIGSRFGDVPDTLPSIKIIPLSWDLIQKMFSPALTIALLGSIESLLSAVVADGMLGTKHKSDMELVAQGIGNIISPMFLGIPATGAIARTATNIKNGGRTPISGMVHAVTLLLIMLVFGKLAALIPMATLAAILIYVSYNMSEWRSFVRILKYPKTDVTVLVTTFLLTVLVDLTVAIEVGVLLSAFLFIRRMESVSDVEIITEELREANIEPSSESELNQKLPQGVEVFEVFGPLFFSAIERFKSAMSRVKGAPKVLILCMQHVLAIDGSGLQALESLAARLRKDRSALIISGATKQTLSAIEEAQILPKENLCDDLDKAITRSKQLISL